MDTARTCAFCERDALEVVLEETPHFLLLADYAPLIEGHLLIVPRSHLACYGALPEEWEEEFFMLKARVAAFLRGAYAEPTFFEHGVYHQTVFHAHLHAFPFGTGDLALPDTAVARRAQSHADLRDWYTERGHYFYVEPPTRTGESSALQSVTTAGYIFPPDEAVYRPTLVALWRASSSLGAMLPAQVRRLGAREKMARAAAAWEEFTHHEGSHPSSSAER